MRALAPQVLATLAENEAPSPQESLYTALSRLDEIVALAGVVLHAAFCWA